MFLLRATYNGPSWVSIAAIEYGDYLGAGFMNPAIQGSARRADAAIRGACVLALACISATLTAAGIDTLIITGLTTSGCVRATCVDASSHGFIPIIVADACGDRHEDPHRANLFDMNAKYGDVVDEQKAIDYLAGLGR